MKNLIRRMMIIIAILTVIEATVAALLFSKYAVIGVLIGSGGSSVNLMSLWYDIKRMEEKKVYKRNFLARYVFNASLFLFSGLIGIEAIVGTFFGLINLKLSAFLMGFWRDKGE